MNSIYDFSVETIDGKKISLDQYEGKVLLVVNTASKCGFTPQLKELEETYQNYGKDGFEVLAFPCNQFGGQEPGSNEQIQEFCEIGYKTTFPLFSKVDVKGDKASPLFQYLTESLPGLLGSKAIKWNFTKFLIGPDGVPVKRFAPKDSVKSVVAPEIEKLL